MNEDVSPIKNADFLLSCDRFLRFFIPSTNFRTWWFQVDVFPFSPFSFWGAKLQVSNEKSALGWLGYIGDEVSTQLYFGIIS